MRSADSRRVVGVAVAGSVAAAELEELASAGTSAGDGTVVRDAR